MATTLPNTAKIPPIPSAEKFCLTIPMYEEVKFDNDDGNPFFALEQFEGTLDFHCLGCGSHSVFTASKNSYASRTGYSNYYFRLVFHCSRNRMHQALFFFRAHEGTLQKIGQYPSLADLAMPDLRKYRTVLGDDRFRELNRAIGLTTHGVGAGAFVYLRRIFESLIEEAKEEAQKNADWDAEAFGRARMEEKISLLKDYLPNFLVQNRGLYGVLSVGVHTLSEQECLAAFPAVRVAIEFILDDLLEKHERDAKVKAAAKSLEALKASTGRAGA